MMPVSRGPCVRDGLRCDVICGEEERESEREGERKGRTGERKRGKEWDKKMKE